MTGLDTNVLARYFAKDDPVQSPMASRVMLALTQTDPGWVSTATILELVWFLSAKARVPRDGLVRILRTLLAAEEIVLEEPELIDGALRGYQKGNADFADYVIAFTGRAAGCTRTLTFDERAARDAGMELIR